MVRINKKAVQLSLQTVVVGIVLLVVLAVVLFIFSRNISAQDTLIGDQIANADNEDYVEGLLGGCESGETRKITRGGELVQQNCVDGKWQG